MAIDQIENGESGSSARSKLNQAIDQASSVDDMPDGELPVKSGDVLVPSLARQEGVQGLSVDGEVTSTKDSINIGGGLTLSEDGGAFKIDDKVDDIRTILAGTRVNADGTTGDNLVIRRFNLTNEIIQPLDNENLIGTWSAWVPITLTRVLFKITARFGQAAEGGEDYS